MAQGARDDAERAKRRMQLYAPPKEVAVERRRAAPAAPAAGVPGRGLTSGQAAALMAQMAREDSALTRT